MKKPILPIYPPRTSIALLCSLVISALLTAQSATVTLSFNTPGVTLKVDQQPAQTVNQAIATLTLEPGSHRLQAWAPMRQLWDTMVTVQANAPQRINVKLRFSSMYYEKARADSLYATTRFWNSFRTTSLIALNAGLIWYTGFQGFRQKQKYLDAMEFARVQYQSNISQENISFYKNSYQKNKKDYDQLRNYLKWKNYIGVPVTLASMYFSYKIIKKRSRPSRQRWEDKNPLADWQWNFRPELDFTQKYHGFTLSIQWQ